MRTLRTRADIHIPPTRFGRPTRSMTCKNKECGKGTMQDIGSRDFENHHCYKCGSHWSGRVGEQLKFQTRKEWDDEI